MKIVSVMDLKEVGGDSFQSFLLSKALDCREIINWLPVPGEGSVKGTYKGFEIHYPTYSHRCLQIVRELKPDVLLIHAFSTDLLNEIEKIRQHCRVAYVMHFNLYEAYITDDFRFLLNPLIQLLQSLDLVVCLSEQQRSTISKITRAKTVVIPPALECEKYKNIQACASGNEFIMASRLYPIKNHLTPIIAMKDVAREVPDAFLSIYGSTGRLYHDLAMLITNLRLMENVGLFGHVKHEQLISAMCMCRALISSSFNENCNLAELEALALGIPVIKENPFSPQAWGEKMLDVLRNYDSYKEEAEKKRSEAERHDVNRIKEIYRKELEIL